MINTENLEAVYINRFNRKKDRKLNKSFINNVQNKNER